MQWLVYVILFLPLFVAALVILISPVVLVLEWKKIRRGPAPGDKPTDPSADDDRRPGATPSNGSANGSANGHAAHPTRPAKNPLPADRLRR